MGVTEEKPTLLERIMPETPYRWRVTAHHTADCKSPGLGDNRTGTAGPGRMCGRFDITTRDQFRLLDAAGRVVLEGQTNVMSIAKHGGVTGFEPLNDIGCGAVAIEYFIKDTWTRPKGVNKDGKKAR